MATIFIGVPTEESSGPEKAVRHERSSSLAPASLQEAFDVKPMRKTLSDGIPAIPSGDKPPLGDTQRKRPRRVQAWNRALVCWASVLGALFLAVFTVMTQMSLRASYHTCQMGRESLQVQLRELHQREFLRTGDDRAGGMSRQRDGAVVAWRDDTTATQIAHRVLELEAELKQLYNDLKKCESKLTPNDGSHEPAKSKKKDEGHKIAGEKVKSPEATKNNKKIG